MKVNASLSTYCGILALVATVSHGQIPVLDQSHLDGEGWIGANAIAQTFPVTVTGELSRVDLRVRRNTTTSFLFIYDTNANGVPTDALTGAFAFTQGATPEELVSIDVSEENLFVTAGDRLAAYVVSAGGIMELNASTFGSIDRYLDGETYAPGLGGFNLIVDGVVDLHFQTFVQPIPEPTAISICLVLAVGMACSFRRVQRE